MIDYNFINQLEGYTTTGYVPDPAHSKSGVTIACGYDLGQRTVNELHRAFEPALAAKLARYAGVKQDQACELLEQTPLTVSDAEAQVIAVHVHEGNEQLLRARWRKSMAYTDFNNLPDECQTVLASVAFQYGHLEQRCPRFWQYAIRGDWPNVLKELRNFGDRYTTRRHKEADLLQRSASTEFIKIA